MTRKYYLDPETPAKDVVGYYFCNEVIANPFYHTHNYCEIILIIDGELIHHVNSHTLTLKKMNLSFIRADDVHKFETPKGVFATGYNIGIPQKILQETVDYLGVDFSIISEPNLPHTIALLPDVFNKYVNMVKNLHAEPLNYEHGLNIKIFFAELLRLFFISPHSINTINDNLVPFWFTSLINDFEKNNFFIEGLQKLIECSNVNQSYLNRCFKKYLNTTPTIFINMLRVNYAKKLFLTNNYNISDIAYECGFNSLSNFYREFKKIEGCTPKEYLATKTALKKKL